MYHGWNDTAISAGNAVNYYSSVLDKMGQKQDDWIRLFMAPGMQHCGGGPGADSFGVTPGLAPVERDASRNLSAALERWVEEGAAPGAIVATKYKAASPASGVSFTRPLCPYPQAARYKGSGDQSDAASFVCK
jgi:feruloyl esterase